MVGLWKLINISVNSATDGMQRGSEYVVSVHAMSVVLTSAQCLDWRYSNMYKLGT